LASASRSVCSGRIVTTLTPLRARIVAIVMMTSLRDRLP
jgi:hypothetical protein